MIYIFKNFDTFTDEDFEHFLPLLSETRQEKVKKYHFMKDKKLGLVAYLLLRIGLLYEYGIKEIPDFSYNEYKKPYLKNSLAKEISFNLSHCNGMAACVINHDPVGIDVQDVAEYSDGMARHVMSLKEKDMVEQSNDPNKNFTVLWTLKESYLKYVGTGISDQIRSADFSDYTWRPFNKYDCDFFITQIGNVLLALCSNNPELYKEFRYITRTDLYNYEKKIQQN